jgi:hypothetical protein
MSMLDEDDSYSGDDDDFGDGAGDSSQHSQDWQEQQQTGAAAGGQRRADSQQMSTSSARRGKRKGAYTEEERRYRRRLANRCVTVVVVNWLVDHAALPSAVIMLPYKCTMHAVPLQLQYNTGDLVLMQLHSMLQHPAVASTAQADQADTPAQVYSAAWHVHASNQSRLGCAAFVVAQHLVWWL